MQLLPPQSIDPNVPAQIPRGSAPGLQGLPGHRARHRGRRRGARRADARPPAVGWSRGDRRRLERAQDRVQRHARALVPRACRARDRDSPDAAPLLQRPDPGRGLHVPGHGGGRRDLAPEPVHLRCRVRRLHGDDRAGAGVRRTARSGMVRREPDDPRDRGRERVLLVPRRADDGRAARARTGRTLLPDLRAGDLGAGGARDRDPLGPRVHPLAAVRAARVPVLGMVPHAHRLHALRRRGRCDPPCVHGRGHGLRHHLYRRP